MSIKGVIFDLDETLVDTRALKQYRDSRNWRACYDNVNKTQCYGGIIDFFHILEKNNIPVGIVTMSPRKYAETLLHFHKIKYQTLVAYHDCQNRKPHPEPMIKCAKQIRVEPSELIAFGDDKNDIISANSAGMFSIGVTWGKCNEDELKSVNASFICHDISEAFGLPEINGLTI